jgi:hypothetical protein
VSDVVDPVVAMVELVRCTAGLSAAAGGRVFGAELPAKEQGAMPRGAVVVAVAGIGSMPPGGGDVTAVRSTRIDVRCYGETPAQAGELGAMIDRHLHVARRQTLPGGIVVWHATRVAGPVAYRSAPGDWPVSVWTYDLLHATSVVD